VVCGGAELYVTVSSMQAAGSKLPHLEITSDHLTITAACGASLTLLENVLGLLEEDAQHDLHSQLGPTSCSPELHAVQRIAGLSLHPMLKYQFPRGESHPLQRGSSLVPST
jgi:hypothetical protein